MIERRQLGCIPNVLASAAIACRCSFRASGYILIQLAVSSIENLLYEEISEQDGIVVLVGAGGVSRVTVPLREISHNIYVLRLVLKRVDVAAAATFR